MSRMRGDMDGTYHHMECTHDCDEVEDLGCLGLKPTLLCHQVPLLWREENIERGFRPSNQSWHYYVRSALQLHNETMNMWTHFIGALLGFLQLLKFSVDVDFIHDAYAWPFLTGITGGIALYLCSTGAHTMQSKSARFHYSSFMVDYAGIGIYGLSSVIVHYEYCSEANFHDAVRLWFIPTGCILACLICVCCTHAKIRYQRPYPWQRKIFNIVPIVLIYSLLVSPILHRLHACFLLGRDCNDSILFHVAQIFFFILSGFFYASDLPQKLLPHGSCDYFLHSHQLFHICISTCTLMQMEGVYRDFHERSDFLRSRPPPTLASAFAPMALTMLLEVILIVAFNVKVKRILQKLD